MWRNNSSKFVVINIEIATSSTKIQKYRNLIKIAHKTLRSVFQNLNLRFSNLVNQQIYKYAITKYSHGLGAVEEAVNTLCKSITL